MTSVESWNGQWGDELGRTREHQCSFHLWFENVAFGGTNYANTPVGALTTVWEPNAVCFIGYAPYLKLWAEGKPFAICAWNAGLRPTVQVTGDPLVRR